MTKKSARKMEASTRVRARLRLAQQLLEESDTLPGVNGYAPSESDNGLYHQRHEREALVVYLLLTCFDLLGQTQHFLTFSDWLNSEKAHHMDDRKVAVDGLYAETVDHVDVAKKLYEHYNRTYGVRNAFETGISQLPADARDHLLSTVFVSALPPEAFNPANINVIFTSSPIENPIEEYQLKIKYLYRQRNAFTHRLVQRHFSSMPIMNGFGREADAISVALQNDASWGVFVFEGKVSYGLIRSQQRMDNKYVVSVSDWPFVLFEVLYAAIGESFDRTQIRLRFFLFAQGADLPGVFYLPAVAHKDLSSTLERKLGVTLQRWECSSIAPQDEPVRDPTNNR